MGSWSMTCAVTGLSVDAGDEVRMVALLKENKGLNAGSSCDYSPMSGGVPASYDDYGFVVDAKPTALHRLLAEAAGSPDFDDWMERVKDGDLRSLKIENKTAGDDPEGASPAHSTFTLIHERAWQELLAFPSRVELDYTQDRRLSVPEAIAMAENEIVEWARGFPEAQKAYRQSMGADQADAGSRLNDILGYLWESQKYDSIPKKGAIRALFGDQFWSSYHNSMGGESCQAVWAALSKDPASIPEHDLRSIVRELAEITLVGHAIYALRKRWEPAPHGPQFGDPAAHWLWHQAVGAIVNERFEAQMKSNAEDDYEGDEVFQAAKATHEKDAISAHTRAEGLAPRKPGGI